MAAGGTVSGSCAVCGWEQDDLDLSASSAGVYAGVLFGFWEYRHTALTAGLFLEMNWQPTYILL